jgi:soluble lytic murein transglycosylase-like protein
VSHPLSLQIQLVGARPIEYAEIDDARGRVAGAAVALSLGSEGRRHGAFVVPALDEGQLANAWLVTSSEPTLAARANDSGATLARPLRPRSSGDACADAGEAASLVVPPFPRWIALDGFASRDRAPELHRARLARALALGILGLAAFLETLVILATTRAARREVKDVASAEDALSEAAVSGSRAPIVLAMIVVTWLGFGVLASLILTRF